MMKSRPTGAGGALHKGFWRRAFARNDDGSTALEFALVAPLFFTAMLSIFEVAMVFGTSVMLEAAAYNAARAVRTGQIYEATLPALLENDQKAEFETALCAELIFIDCNELSYDVRVYNDFSSVNHTVHCDANGDIDSPEFAIGLPAQIVVVTIVYPYEPLLPNPLPYAGRDYKSAAEGGCNGLSMRSILVFRNEPFPQA